MNAMLHDDAARVTETPNAVMTTLASPTLNGTQSLSLWKVRMQSGQSGPVHAFDSEQVWHLLEGSATIEIDGIVHTLNAGDSLTIPGMAARQVTASAAAEFIVCGHGHAKVVTGAPGGKPLTPAWIA